MKHPKFDALMEKFYKVLKEPEKVHKLSQKSDLIELKEMEYLIGIDICSFRIPQCRSILGDRNISITSKRLKAKMRLSDIVDLDQHVIGNNQNSHIASSIQNPTEIGDKPEDQSETEQIKQLLTSTESEDETFDFEKVKREELKSDLKSHDQIYQEVVIDEINTEMLKNIAK